MVILDAAGKRRRDQKLSAIIRNRCPRQSGTAPQRRGRGVLNRRNTHLQVADNKYISQVYFHTLFLYSILKQKKMRFSLEDQQGDKPVEVEEVPRDLFKSSYCEFLLRFGGTEELIAAID